MRQPEDNRTIDLLEPEKRRGRPRLPNALTPAQRAKRYRQNKKKKAPAAARNATELDPDRLAIEKELERAKQLIADLKSGVDLALQAYEKGKRLSAEVASGLATLLHKRH